MMQRQTAVQPLSLSIDYFKGSYLNMSKLRSDMITMQIKVTHKLLDSIYLWVRQLQSFISLTGGLWRLMLQSLMLADFGSILLCN